MPGGFEQKTIREPLLGAVLDHLTHGGITNSRMYHIGCELVALLSSYREEDRRLFPEVYLLDTSDAPLLPILSPGVKPIAIGQSSIADRALESGARKAARTILKNCAPLAIGGWAIYVEMNGRDFAYGLFRSSLQTYSNSAVSVLASSELPAAVFRNSAENAVEIINGQGSCLEFSLTTSTPSTRALSGQIVEFTQAACKDIVARDRGNAVEYLSQLLSDFLRSSHGALMAVAPSGQALGPPKFSQGVIFDHPIPLIPLMLAAKKEKTASADSILRSHESLLLGMIQSDGVTILGTNGTIKAFRVFVHSTRRRRRASSEASSGGARSIAYSVLCESMGDPLMAALIRSQDGRTEVEVQA